MSHRNADTLNSIRLTAFMIEVREAEQNAYSAMLSVINQHNAAVRWTSEALSPETEALWAMNLAHRADLGRSEVWRYANEASDVALQVARIEKYMIQSELDLWQSDIDCAYALAKDAQSYFCAARRIAAEVRSWVDARLVPIARLYGPDCDVAYLWERFSHFLPSA